MKKIVLIIVLFLVASAVYSLNVTVEKAQEYGSSYYTLKTDEPVTSMVVSVVVVAYDKEVMLWDIVIEPDYTEYKRDRLFNFKTTKSRLVSDEGVIFIEERKGIHDNEAEEIRFIVESAKFFTHKYEEINVEQ